MLPSKDESLNRKVRWLLSFIDAAGYAFFSPLIIYNKLFKRYDPNKVRRIAIFRLDQLGDFVISTGALREIRCGFPNARITLIVTSQNKTLAEQCPFVDEVIVYNNFLFRALRGDRRLRLVHELRTLGRLRNKKFDLGIDLRSDLLSIVPMFLSGIRFRFARDRRGGGFLLTHIVHNPTGIRNEINKTFLITEALETEVKEKTLFLPVNDENSQAIERYLQKQNLKRYKPIVVMAPCTHWIWRAWPPDKFAELCRKLIEKFGITILLIGARQENKIIEGIVEKAGPGIINTAGDFTLAEIIALINKCDMFVGNDSGMIHIAAAFHKPMVQLFGPGPPDTFAH